MILKLYAPKYYESFKCIADKCTHSCCIGWEIDIDKATFYKYSMLSDGYGINIRNSIDDEDTPHFRLCEDERCPHLSKNGLCSIITEFSEDFLCDICREHPRFYNDTAYGKEVGIGMACEEACRIILTSDEYNKFTEVGEEDGEPEQLEFDAIAERERIYALLSDRSIPYTERLTTLYGIYDTTPDLLSGREWHDVIDSLEYLDEEHRALFLNYSPDLSTPYRYALYLERTLAYFIFRHCSDAFCKSDFTAKISFCFFCERLLASLLKSENVNELSDIIRLAVTVSEEIEYSEENTEELIFQIETKRSYIKYNL